MKQYLLLLTAFMGCFTAPAQVALTPPMGWNSYNCFGSAVHEDEVKANAAYMAEQLKPFGWNYIVVDFLWAYDNPPGSLIGNPFQQRLPDGAYIPWLAMDQWGRLQPEPGKFPSAFGDRGFAPLAAYVHAKGLKFGIHVMRGIPRQAVWAKSPVKGAPGITADQVADTLSTCTWLNHMYGLNMQKPGAQAYLNSLLDLYASWGVDFIKVDDISRPYHSAEIEGYRKAIDQCGRPIVLSLSPGATPPGEAQHLVANSNMWRMADDFWDNWKEILQMMDYARQWQGRGGPGHWPDCDMLQLGKLSKRGPVGVERYSRFTDDELYTQLSFWCIFRSPLMIGGNLPENRDIELLLLTNPEVLAVNQQGENPTELVHNDSSRVWISQAPGGTGIYAAFFNTGNHPQAIRLPAGAGGLSGQLRTRDLWKKTDTPGTRKKIVVYLAPHASALMRISHARAAKPAATVFTNSLKQTP